MAILGNGPSILNHDLSTIAIPTIGTNRSHRIHDSTYFCAIDHAHYREAPRVFERLAREDRLFVGANQKWPCGHVMTELPRHTCNFSRDLEKGWVISLHGPGSIVHCALQLAAWMGFTTAYLLGVDFTGPHFDGTPAYQHMEIEHNEMMQAAKDESGMGLFLCGSPESRCLVLPHVPFEAVQA